MKESQRKKLISDMHFDINNLYDAWYDHKIDDKLTIEKILNLCFSFLRTVVDDAIKK